VRVDGARSHALKFCSWFRTALPWASSWLCRPCRILLFGYAVHFEPREVPIAIARERAEPEGSLRHAIAEANLFRVLGDGLPRGAAAALVAQHQALVGIEFPRSESETQGLSPERIEAVIDGTDPETVRPAVLSLEATLLRRTMSTQPLRARSARQGDLALQPRRPHNLVDRSGACGCDCHDHHAPARRADPGARARARHLGRTPCHTRVRPGCHGGEIVSLTSCWAPFRRWL